METNGVDCQRAGANYIIYLSLVDEVLRPTAPAVDICGFWPSSDCLIAYKKAVWM